MFRVDVAILLMLLEVDLLLKIEVVVVVVCVLLATVFKRCPDRVTGRCHHTYAITAKSLVVVHWRVWQWRCWQIQQFSSSGLTLRDSGDVACSDG